MARRQITLFLLIVCLPLAMLAWLGSRLAQNEQRTARQRLADVAAERLRDVDRVIANHFRQRERDLLELTELDSYDPQRLRQIVRSRPGIGQLFVVTSDGTLLHPDPAGTLNASEREFLLHTRQTFDDKAFLRNRNSEEGNAQPVTYAWHIQYWGPGLNLVFYHRLPSGYVVGVHVPRSRWIADLIAELPDTGSSPSPPNKALQGFLPGQIIGDANDADGVTSGRNYMRSSGYTPGDWEAGNGVPSYIGFKIDIDNDSSFDGFGWIEVIVNDPDPTDTSNRPDITVTRWAYTDDGSPIAAGVAGVVPEPSTLALLAAGLGAMALGRKRK